MELYLLVGDDLIEDVYGAVGEADAVDRQGMAHKSQYEIYCRFQILHIGKVFPMIRHKRMWKDVRRFFLEPNFFQICDFILTVLLACGHIMR